MKKMKIIIFLSLALISTVSASENIENDVCRIDDDTCKKDQNYRENLELHLVGENHNSTENRTALQQLAKDEKIILFEENPFRHVYHAPAEEKWNVTRFMLEDKYFEVLGQCIGVICSHPAHENSNMFNLEPHFSDKSWDQRGVNIKGFGWLPNRRESVVPAAFDLLKEEKGEEFMQKEFGDYYPYKYVKNYEEKKFFNKNMIPLAKKLGHHILNLLKDKKGDTKWMQKLEATRDPENIRWQEKAKKDAYNFWVKGGEKTITWIENLLANPNTKPGIIPQGCFWGTHFYAALHDKVQSKTRGIKDGNAGLAFKGLRNMIFVENTVDVLSKLKPPHSKLPVFLVIGEAHLPDTAERFEKFGVNVKRWVLEALEAKKLAKVDLTQKLKDQKEFDEFLEELKN